MVEFLSSWAGNITVSVIIATMIEMILPEGKNRKYIKTVIGVYILFVILSPIITKISGQEIDMQNMFEGYETTAIEASSLNTEESIKEIYLSNLKTDITSKLKQRGYEVLQIQVEIEENYEKINKIIVSLKKAEDSTIKKVEIGKQESEKLTTSEIKEIKEYLSTTYDVQEKNITVN